MRFTNISIENYKSLKRVSIQPDRLTLLVGANASGKSNFTDCLDFISEVYRHGLEVAVSRKGGYDNIAFRRRHRSKVPIRISLCAEIELDEIFYSFYEGDEAPLPSFRIEHSFSFVARGESIKAEFNVVSERIIVDVKDEDDWVQAVSIDRQQDSFESVLNPEFSGVNKQNSPSRLEYALDFRTLDMFKERNQPLPSTELIINVAGRFIEVLYSFSRTVGGLRTFQLSPAKSRELGVPTPRPELDRYGGNLPAVIDTMQKYSVDEWKLVMQSMRSILPGLADIEVDYTTTRRLGLFFKEHGFRRAWSVEEISDGTIQTLALLVALYDPYSTALIIEEPENSVHPWIIRHVMQACMEASRRKQILITSHSPIVMDSVKPEQIWVVWRADGESHIEKISNLDSDFLSMWQEGDVSTFEYIDSGAVEKALPPAPSEQTDLNRE